MGQQMEPNGPIQERYSGYAGQSSYAEQPYQAPPYSQPAAGGAYDDAFVDDLAQRISQRADQNSAGKAYAQPLARKGIEPGQRLALAIVSVVMLVPISAILMDSGNGFIGLISFAIACLAIVLVNAIFNDVFKHI